MCQHLASLSVLMELRVNLISGVAQKSKPGRLAYQVKEKKRGQWQEG
jgi:hypothetical protein